MSQGKGQQLFDEWISQQPEPLREAAAKKPPGKHYSYEGMIGHVASYQEDGTVRFHLYFDGTIRQVTDLSKLRLYIPPEGQEPYPCNGVCRTDWIRMLKRGGWEPPQELENE